MINSFSTKGNVSGLVREKFQKKIDGKQTDLFILKNPLGMEVAVTNYGCAILSIMVPDKNGTYANVVLGHDSVDNVINSPEPFLNTVIGRYGNRIGGGKFTLEDTEYTLNLNSGSNSLHGGSTGFHTKVWDARQIDERTLELSYLSPDNEEGFPGNLSVTMTYGLDENENALIINYIAKTDQTTVINLTNHAFFNLAGIANPTPSIEDHVVTINADYYIPMDESSIPTGEILRVEDTPMDFRTPHAIGERINDTFQQLIYGKGYDHCYVLDKEEAGELSWAVSCADQASGRILEVYTTEPGVQLYTGNWLNGFTGAHEAVYPARSGICFEAQCFPDSPNIPHFPTVVLTPEDEYQQITIYKFDIQD